MTLPISKPNTLAAECLDTMSKREIVDAIFLYTEHGAADFGDLHKYGLTPPEYLQELVCALRTMLDREGR